MYNVYVDGNLLYSTSPGNEENIIINPKISLEVNEPGLFSFTMPPGHRLYDSIEKLKSTVKVEYNSETLFEGRVTDEETDFYRQKNINCESELSYFRDSIQHPYEFEGTPYSLFEYLINTHNGMVSTDQQFTIGNVTAIENVGTAQVETDEYSTTLQELKSRMIAAYGGYLSVRCVNGVRYIDYLADGSENEQPIQFGVNLLDLKKSIHAEDVFNVLIPQGAMVKGDNGRYTEPLKITKINNGLDYIEDAESIAKYGKRIWKTKQWPYIEDAEKLLEKAHEYLLTGIDEETTFVINAVDMHFADPEQQRIGIGNSVQIISTPHGISREEICTKIALDMLNPENTQYTLGKPPLTLTDNIVLVKKQTGGGSGSGNTVQEDMAALRRWAYAAVDDANANIQLSAGQLNTLTGQMTNTQLELNGINATILLKAEKAEVDSLGDRMHNAEIALDGAHGRITAQAEEINLKADKIDLGGYVAVENLGTEIAKIADLTVQTIRADEVYTDYTETEQLVVNEGAAISGHLSVASLDIGGEGNNSPAATQAWVNGESRANRSIKNMSVSGNTLTIELYDGTTLNFSKASVANLVQTWSGGRMTITTDTSGLSLTGQTVCSINSGAENEEYTASTKTIKCNVTSQERGTIYTGLVVDAKAAYDAGYAAGQDAGYDSGYDAGYAAAPKVANIVQTWSGGRLTITTNTSGMSLTGQVSCTVDSSPKNLWWSGNRAYFDITSDKGTILSDASINAAARYNAGWNACRSAATAVPNVYQLSATPAYPLYYLINGNYSSAGSGWMKGASKGTLYTLPAAK